MNDAPMPALRSQGERSPELQASKHEISSLILRLKEFQDLPIEFPEHVNSKLWPVVLTIIDRQFLSGNPFEGPCTRPVFGVCAGVVDHHFVPQRVQIGTREAFNQMKLLCMRKPAVGKP